MKCFLGVVLTLHLVVEFCSPALIGSTIADLFKLEDTGLQKVCKSGVKTLCHKEVRSNVTPTLSKMCVDGKIKLVRVPEGYNARTDGLEKCTYAGKTFCDGDKIVPNYKGWSTRHYCLNGDFRYSVTGKRLKTNKSIFAKPSSASSSGNKNSNKNDSGANNNVEDSSEAGEGESNGSSRPSRPSFLRPETPTTKRPKKTLFNPFAQRPRPQGTANKNKNKNKKGNKNKNKNEASNTSMDEQDSDNNMTEDTEDKDASSSSKPAFSQCK